MENVKHSIEDVLTKASEYLKKQVNLDTIKRAYELAKKQHEGQFRKSNDPYIQHPLEVAYMLTELHAGPNTIAAGFLHDVLEDTDITREKMEEMFGSDITNIVDGVTKISKLKYMTQEKVLAKTHQKILIAMAKDIRVILVKLVDRVHNMRTLEYQPLEKQKKIARETIELYAPLAHRLGMYRIKAELEDLSYRYLDPEGYEKINGLITIQKDAREEDIQKMQDNLIKLLDYNRILNYQLKGRIKNVYSVCEKMQRKSLQFDEIYDIMALRILVPSIEDCYHVLGVIHGEWNPIPGRFKDYIATPKPNLYQSLHTTIVGPNGKIYEIQIRTYEMDNVAENGIAAHWSYKEENKNYSPQREQEEISTKMRWYKDLLNYTEVDEDDDGDPFQNVKEDIFSASVYVFTPKGDVLDFPSGATPLDFAYRVHTEIGNKTVGAIINGRIVPLSYRLKTGDVIEIKTSPNFNGPVESWLKIVKTTHAKHKIIAILNKRQRELLISEGKEEFEKTCKVEGFGVVKVDDKIIKKHFSRLNINTLDDFYYEIGKKGLSAKGAANRILGNNEEKIDDESLIKHYQDSPNSHKKNTNDYGILVDGLDKAQIKLASCCHPVLGDEIVGFVSKGQGIVVHRAECHNNFSNNQERLINVYWDYNYNNKFFESLLLISSFDRKNIIADIVNILSGINNLNITSITSNRSKSGDLLTKLKLNIDSLDTLNDAINKLQMIQDLYTIERVIK